MAIVKKYLTIIKRKRKIRLIKKNIVKLYDLAEGIAIVNQIEAMQMNVYIMEGMNKEVCRCCA